MIAFVEIALNFLEHFKVSASKDTTTDSHLKAACPKWRLVTNASTRQIAKMLDSLATATRVNVPVTSGGGMERIATTTWRMVNHALTPQCATTCSTQISTVLHRQTAPLLARRRCVDVVRDSILTSTHQDAR